MSAAHDWMSVRLGHQDPGFGGSWKPLLSNSNYTYPSHLGGSIPETVDASPPAPVSITSLSMPWLANAIAVGPETYKIEHLTEIVAALDDHLHAGHFDLIGDALRAMPVDLLSVQTLVTVMRTTGTARHLIPRWQSSVAAVATSLDKRNLDSKRLLRGII
jgi:hypothetical protein